MAARMSSCRRWPPPPERSWPSGHGVRPFHVQRGLHPPVWVGLRRRTSGIDQWNTLLAFESALAKDSTAGQIREKALKSCSAVDPGTRR